LRAELVERAFALTLDRGGMRRSWLRGRENIQKRYLIHIAGHNLGLIMRLLTGSGTPRRWAGANSTLFWLWMPVDGDQRVLVITLAVRADTMPGAWLAIAIGSCPP